MPINAIFILVIIMLRSILYPACPVPVLSLDTAMAVYLNVATGPFATSTRLKSVNPESNEKTVLISCIFFVAKVSRVFHE